MKKYMSWMLVLYCVLLMLCGCSDVAVNRAKTVNETEYIEQTEEPRESLVEGMELYPIYKDIKVHFIDVGQGDCTFIELPNGQTLLIDAGNPENGRQIINYINNIFEYDEIDYVVATHPHEDHIGGMAEVISYFDVGSMYMPEKSHTSYTFENLIDTIENRGIDLYKAKAGTNILTSGLIKIDLLAPFDEQYSNLNNYSAVVKITYGETVFLFMGDAESQVEYKLLKEDIDADVLKVGHHGSDSSSTEFFISEVSPECAVISCGADNQYGHPDNTTLAILNDYKANIYRTDEVGTVIVTADGHKKISVDKKASEIKENAPPQQTAIPFVATELEYTPESKQGEIQQISATVYKTRTGECYHLGSCSSLRKSKIPTTVEDAQAIGLRACKNCRPPQ